jgi:hypothetical protein
MSTETTMNQSIKPIVAIALGVANVFALHAGAQSDGGPYRIERSVIAGGGGTISGGTFQLRGSVGQNVAAASSAAGYTFYTGFWSPDAGAAPTDLIFANGFDP